MPTKSNNIGGRGGARPGAGRKKSAVKDKAAAGNPGGRPLEVLDIPEMEGVEMPKPHDFLSAEQRDGSHLQATAIYENTWKFIPYANNVRTHSKDQINKLCSIYRGIGYGDPVEVDENFTILSGHGRVEAAKAEGMTQLPYVMLTGMTEAEKKAYILAVNRSALDAGWDEELLAVEIESLAEMGFDMSLTAFDEKELAALYGADGDEAKDDDLDLSAALEKAAFVLHGDIWTVGRHRLIVDRETWEAAQLEMTRREGYRQRHGITSIGRANGDQLHSKIFCGKCGGKFLRRYWKGNTSIFWKCENADKKKGKKCDAEIVREKEILEGIVKGWNELIGREDSSPHWQEMAAGGNALQRYRGRLFLAMSTEGKLEKEIPEMTRCFLEEIVIEKDNMLIRFLDGSEVRVEMESDEERTVG